MQIIAASSVSALLLLATLVFFLRNDSPRDPSDTASTNPSADALDVEGSVSSATDLVQPEARRSLAQDVANANVVLVATATSSAPAPLRKPGDTQEFSVKFRVKRVLKGKLTERNVTTRTPTAADEFIGHDWVLLLSPDFMAGKHQYATCVTGKVELEVKAMLEKGQDPNGDGANASSKDESPTDPKGN
jgi:hypothetical protein